MNGIEGILAQIQQGGQDPYAQMNPQGMPPQGMPMQEMPPQLAPQQMPQQQMPQAGPLMEPPLDRIHQAYMGGADLGSGLEDSLAVTAEDIEKYLMMFQRMMPSQDGAKTNEVTIKIRKSR
jgi:hypothetical protein